MKTPPRPLPTWLKWLCRLFGVVILVSLLLVIPGLLIATVFVVKGLQVHKTSGEAVAALLGNYVGFFLMTWLGIWLVRWPKKKKLKSVEISSPVSAPIAIPAVPSSSTSTRNKHWSSCNILQLAPDASRLWQFDAKGGGFALNREHRVAIDQLLPFRLVAKSWRSLWQPRLNVAWLPPENVFLRVVELPRSSFDETFAMVELQLEKLSPMPVAQIVWTIHVLSRPGGSPRRREAGAEEATGEEAKAEDLQTVVVVMAERGVVEEFLGKLEGRGYLADRLEAPMLDQLEATPATEDGSSRPGDSPRRSETETGAAAEAWIYPVVLAGQSAALVAWWCGGALRNLSFVVLPPTGDRAKNLKAQLAQLVWAGELEGWLPASPGRWHLVADPAGAAEWENALREGLSEPVEVTPPLPPAELAAQTARRAAAAGSRAPLLPAEFPARYHQQFVDRLWLRGLAMTGVLYAIGVVIYFCAVGLLSVQTRKAEQVVANLGGSYTNAMQLRARYDVLKKRQELKYAALDCWKIVAEQLPENVVLQRFSFADGQKLTLSGTAAPEQVNLLFDFNTAMQKATLKGRPMFDPHGGETVSPKRTGNTEIWSFSLPLLQHSEDAP